MARIVLKGDEELSGKEVRLLDDEGQEVGIVSFREALSRSDEEGFDLVEIAAQAKPPVVKLMNYGKFVYEKNKREKAAKKKQHSNKAKEIKFHVNVEKHDYDYKCNHAKEFLEKGYKVKLTIQYRGREMAHKELGFDLMNKIKAELNGLCQIEAHPKLQGRNMAMIVAPVSKK